MRKRLLGITGGLALLLASAAAGRPARRSVLVAGSWSGYRVQRSVGDAFQKTYEIPVGVIGKRNVKGFEYLAAGKMDVLIFSPAADRPTEKALAEKFPDESRRPRKYAFGQFAVHVIVHPDSPVNRLSLRQLRHVFSGKTTEWPDLGGRPGRIVTLGEPGGSKSREMFKRIVMNGATVRTMNTSQNCHSLAAKVAADRNAIGFCLYRQSPLRGVRSLAVGRRDDGPFYPPTDASVFEAKYPLIEDLSLYVRPDASMDARAYCTFACGPEGAQVARKWFLYPELARREHFRKKRLAEHKAGKGVLLHGGGPVKGGLALLKDATIHFVAANTVVQMVYRGLSEPAAVEQFLGGKQQLLLLDKPPSDRTMRAHGAKWKALFAEADETAVALAAKATTQPAKPAPRAVDTSAGNLAAGRGVAVIVSAKLGLDTLSRRQLGDIFTGKARRWDALSREGLIDPTGHARTERWNRIHICRARGGSPAVRLFFEGLKIGYLSSVTRYKNDMAEVITAVTMDKNTIGFIDVADVPANSAAVRVLSVSDGAGRAVRPSMAALLDGSYPLSKQLRLYVSPKASATAKDFARFLLAGGADETFAKHGYVTPGRLRKIAAEKAAKAAAAKAGAKHKGAGGRRR